MEETEWQQIKNFIQDTRLTAKDVMNALKAKVGEKDEHAKESAVLNQLPFPGMTVESQT